VLVVHVCAKGGMEISMLRRITLEQLFIVIFDELR
jgi:hypothetical protein